MSIQFVSVKCPECRANLSIEEGRDFAFCSYCGTKVIMTNENEHIYRNIDEARVKEAETDRMIRLREMELAEKENSRDRKSMIVAYTVALAFVLIGSLICIVQPLAGMWGIIIGGYVALFTFSKYDKKKKNKRKYVGANEVSITDAMEDCVCRNYQSTVMLFQGAGFTNVTAVPLHDLSIFSQKKNGQVETVTINGNEDFEEEDIYPKNAAVLITYHSR